MSGDVAAIGDLVTGGALARAVEPEAGETGAGTSSVCLNCGAPLATAFCGQCGQSAHVHRSIHAFAHDLLHSIFHFDGKIWRTLPMLAFRPGTLTRRYVHGERAKFVSPLALFLFSIFAMFAVFSWVGSPITPKATTTTTRNGVALTAEGINQALAESRKELAALVAKRSSANPPSGIDAEIAGKREEIEGLEDGKELAEGLATGRKLRQGENVDLGKYIRVDTGSRLFDERIRHAIENPQLLLYKVQANAYKFSWLLIPLSLPFMWLLFAWKREVKLYDHLVFITYSLCFITFLLVTMSFLARAGPLEALRAPLLLLGPPLHMFFQLRGAYALSWKAALWRTSLLLMASIMVLSIFALILLALGVS